MTKSTVVHGSFTIDRNYKATPQRVFTALTKYEAMKEWFAGPPEWGPEQLSVDFRIGGGITSAGGPPGGPLHKMVSRFYDIVENQRLIYAYEMYLDDKRISVSVATFELEAVGKGTRLLLTEHGAYLDGLDGPRMREEGTNALLDALGRAVEAS